MPEQITRYSIEDIRFPTSNTLDGSDAMNAAPDYSAVYLTLETESLAGNGLTFTIGRGNQLCAKAVEELCRGLIGRDFEDITRNFSDFSRELTGESQIRWLGPEKGVVHLAAAAVINALWDLWAKQRSLPLWKLLATLSVEELLGVLDFTHLTDVLSPAEASSMLEELCGSRESRMTEILNTGYPAYTTSVGWLGFSDDKLRSLCREAVAQGWSAFKLKVGGSLQDDVRRCRIAREAIGHERQLFVDANQVWEVDQAIEWMRALAPFRPTFIEEPTHPDDVLGHRKIAQAIKPIKVATGEHCANRVLFKQFLQADALQVCQFDCCRLAGINEGLMVLLLAKKFEVPVCPHAGGVGLCELMQHISIFDYIGVSGSIENRYLEHAGALHEHFVDPIEIRDGHYLAPNVPGTNLTLKPESIEKYRFPDGSYWKSR